MEIHYVYITVCKINGKGYVGDHIWRPFKGRLDSYLGSGRLLQLAIKKYGRNNFDHYILEMFDTKKEAFDAQEKYIKLYDTYNNGYNLDEKGGYYCMGTKERKKLKLSLKEICNTQEFKSKISKALKGKFSGKNNPNYGNHKKKPAITLQRMREAQLQRSAEKRRLEQLEGYKCRQCNTNEVNKKGILCEQCKEQNRINRKLRPKMKVYCKKCKVVEVQNRNRLCPKCKEESKLIRKQYILSEETKYILKQKADSYWTEEKRNESRLRTSAYWTEEKRKEWSIKHKLLEIKRVAGLQK